jgi:DNA invertase Pin-like site-specific DNA recombinase
MNERIKITASHLARQSIVYLRQSSAAQVEHNRESTERQYALAAKAVDLGWSAERVTVIDEDLGLSGSGSVARSGFARLTAEVALGRVGLMLGPRSTSRAQQRRLAPPHRSVRSTDT